MGVHSEPASGSIRTGPPRWSWTGSRARDCSSDRGRAGADRGLWLARGPARCPGHRPRHFATDSPPPRPFPGRWYPEASRFQAGPPKTRGTSRRPGFGAHRHQSRERGRARGAPRGGPDPRPSHRGGARGQRRVPTRRGATRGSRDRTGDVGAAPALDSSRRKVIASGVPTTVIERRKSLAALTLAG